MSNTNFNTYYNMYENADDNYKFTSTKSLPTVNQESKKSSLIFKTCNGQAIEINKHNSSNRSGPKVEQVKSKKLSWTFQHEVPHPTTNQDKKEPIQTPHPIKTQIEKDLTLALNKFTSNNLREIFNQILKLNYHDRTFLMILSKVITTQVKFQSQFPDLYSLFVLNILSILKEDPELCEFFKSIILNQILSYLKVQIPKQKSYNSYYNYATFYGCLANRKIVPISDILSLIQFYISQQEPDKIPLIIIAKILAPCGKLLEESNKSFLMKKIVPLLESLKSDRSIPGDLRYFVYDLLEAKGWDKKLTEEPQSKKHKSGIGILFEDEDEDE